MSESPRSGDPDGFGGVKPAAVVARSRYLQGNSRGRRRAAVVGAASPQRVQLPQDREEGGWRVAEKRTGKRNAGQT